MDVVVVVVVGCLKLPSEREISTCSKSQHPQNLSNAYIHQISN